MDVEREREREKMKQEKLTEEGRADVLGDLIAGTARFGKVAQLFVQHPFELQK